MRRMKILILISMLVSSTALADPGPWYAGLTAGRAQGSLPGGSDDELRAQGFSGIQSSANNSFNVIGLSVGYAFSPRISIEGAYEHIGNSNSNNYDASFPVPPNGVGESHKSWRMGAFSFSAVAKVVTWRSVALFGKASAYYVQGNFEQTTAVIDLSTSTTTASKRSASGSGVVPGAGVGVSFDVTREFALRASYEIVAKKSGLFGAGNDLGTMKLLSTSVSYSF